MNGRRVYRGDDYSFGRMRPGDYGIGPNNLWWLCAPNGDLGTIDPEKHTVTEHATGTITIAPSAVFTDGRPWEWPHIDFPGFGSWHGYLEDGVWREC